VSAFRWLRPSCISWVAAVAVADVAATCADMIDSWLSTTTPRFLTVSTTLTWDGRTRWSSSHTLVNSTAAQIHATWPEFCAVKSELVAGFQSGFDVDETRIEMCAENNGMICQCSRRTRYKSMYITCTRPLTTYYLYSLCIHVYTCIPIHIPVQRGIMLDRSLTS